MPSWAGSMRLFLQRELVKSLLCFGTGACRGLSHLGVEIDSEKNNQKSKKAFEIQTRGSTVKVLVVPTNEELEIAEQTLACIQNLATVAIDHTSTNVSGDDRRKYRTIEQKKRLRHSILTAARLSRKPTLSEPQDDTQAAKRPVFAKASPGQASRA